MNLAELNAVHPTTAPGAPGAPASPSLVDVVARLAAEVAGPLTQALGRVVSLANSGRIDRSGLEALRRELGSARRAGLLGQQIARFAAGNAHLGIERVLVGDVLSAVLTEQAARASAGDAGHRQTLAAACIMADTSLIHTLMQAAAEWATAQARQGSVVDWRLKADHWPPQARLTCRFEHTAPAVEALPEQPALGQGPQATSDIATGPQGMPPAEQPADLPPNPLDSLDWLLLRYSAHLAGVAAERVVAGTHCTLTLTLPHLVNDSLDGVSAVDMDAGIGARALLVGSQVLVLAARRDARQRVREALRGHEVFIDYVPTVAAAMDYCEDGPPQALIYETSFDSEGLRTLQAKLAKRKPAVAMIEITPQGHNCEIGEGNSQVGADALHQTLASVLVMELARRH